MSTYSTPEPIDLAIDVKVGAIEVIASDRTDTVVTVSPSDPDRAQDQRAADDTEVAFDGRRLTIRGPRPRIAVFGPNESVDVTIELPSGSRLTAETAVGRVRGAGALGATRVKSSTGAVDLERTGDLWVRTSLGHVTVGTVDGDAEITADQGRIRLGVVTGEATLRSSHGAIQVDEAGADVEAKLAHGNLEITRALGSVSAKTAFGGIRLDEVSSGAVRIESSFGQLHVGIKPGVAAWLDLATSSGRVRNELSGDDTPDAGADTVSVRARASMGDVEVVRAG